MKLIDIRHPDYNINEWTKYRYTFKAGQEFIDRYLVKYSVLEDNLDFELRKKVTYCPAYAKAAIIDIKNSIVERLCDVKRIGFETPARGVDRNGKNMNMFISSHILPELLSMSCVGVFIDRPPMDPGTTLATQEDPYLYSYQCEDILSWSFDDKQNFTSLLLRDHVPVYEYGLLVDQTTQYRHIILDDVVHINIYDADGELISTSILELSRIPFVMFKISSSLLADVANHQIALLNIESSDLHYLMKANFPFYVEQFDPTTDLMLKQSEDGHDPSIKTGISQGRRYPLNTEQPAFINPSSEPLKAAIEKENEIKKQIRQLVNLALSNLDDRRASAESKQYADRSLETGLAYIGNELQYGEQQILNIWAEYLGSKPSEVKYPQNYSLKTDSERREESRELRELYVQFPSKTFQREVAKQVIDNIMGNRLNYELLNKIKDEIDNSALIDIDPAKLIADVEAGLVSPETASQMRGYPDGEIVKAAKAHAERAARIALAQSKAGARGVADMDDSSDSARAEKKWNKMDDDATLGEGER